MLILLYVKISYGQLGVQSKKTCLICLYCNDCCDYLGWEYFAYQGGVVFFFFLVCVCVVFERENAMTSKYYYMSIFVLDCQAFNPKTTCLICQYCSDCCDDYLGWGCFAYHLPLLTAINIASLNRVLMELGWRKFLTWPLLPSTKIQFLVSPFFGRFILF